MNIKTLASDLETYLAVFRLGSFRQAADRLGVSQPSVSIRLRRLEETLGVRLLDRTTRRVEPTEAGERLAAAAEGLIDGVSGLVSAFRAEAALETGETRVLVSTSLAASIMPAVIARFRRSHAGVRIVLLERMHRNLVDPLIEGRADFALVSGEVIHPEVRFERLLDDDLRVFVPKHHAFASRRSVSIADLAGQPLIMMADSSICRQITQHMQALGLSPQTTTTCEELFTVGALLEQGIGIAVLPRLLQNRIDQNVLSTIELTEGPPPRVIGVAFRQGRSLSSAARALLDHLRRHCARLCSARKS